MTRQEAVQAFRDQVPVTVKGCKSKGFYGDYACRRIEAIEYRILPNGEPTFTVKAEASVGNCTYSGGPEDFYLTE